MRRLTTMAALAASLLCLGTSEAEAQTGQHHIADVFRACQVTLPAAETAFSIRDNCGWCDAGGGTAPIVVWFEVVNYGTNDMLLRFSTDLSKQGAFVGTPGARTFGSFALTRPPVQDLFLDSTCAGVPGVTCGSTSVAVRFGCARRP